jgi:hypothetical protein
VREMVEAPIDAVSKIHLTPDPGVLRAIGLNHAFDSAIADLVDNSIDARAEHVLIRFVVRSGLAKQLLVVDDGRGMDEDSINGAMRLGRPKGVSRSLGHFGMGLKSASFSQASTLTVLSHSIGANFEGRRMRREGSSEGFDVDILEKSAVSKRMKSLAEFLGPSSAGTIVQWDDCRTFPGSRDPAVTTAFLDRKVAELRNHLGLVFHRLLEAHKIDIVVDVWDNDEQQSGLPFEITTIDPFAYTRTGMAGYPKMLVARHKGREVKLNSHIWPGGSDSPQFRLHGKAVEGYQGFFLYRNNRLLMPGGWAGVTSELKARKLARVAIDIEQHLDGFAMSMEKSGVQLTADLVHAIEKSAAKDGTTFNDFLEDASSAFKESNRRVRRRTPILPPGQGVHPRIKQTIERETPLLEGEEPLAIKWTRMAGDSFVDVDRGTDVVAE